MANFKVLTYSGFFVDERLLEKGIYISEVPTLHKEAETMESFKERLVQAHFYYPDYDLTKALLNVDKCTLKLFSLTAE